MKKFIMKLFDLRGVITDGADIKETEILVKIRSPRTGGSCPRCGKWCRSVHDRRKRKIRHDVYEGRDVVLVLTVRRFLCKKCRIPFSEPYAPGLSRGRQSEHFRSKAIRKLANGSFKTTGQEMNVTFPTLLSFLAERKQEIPWPEGEIILNLDEHSFSGRDMKISVGIKNHRMLKDILPDDNKATLLSYLDGIPILVRGRIREVCIDMRAGYLSAILEKLPHAEVVVDKFHLIQELNRQMEEIRKILQPFANRGHRRINRFLLLKNKENLSPTERKKLNDVFRFYERFPTLKGCYIVKERVREMYRCQTKKEAEKIFDEILSILEHVEVGKLAEIRRMLVRWRPYILNYFRSRTTNSYIEGCHNRIKLIKRISYGFRNFTNYALKVTLAFAPLLFVNFPH